MLAQYGITPNDLQFQLQTALEGNVIGTILENERAPPIRLNYKNSEKRSAEDLKRLKLFLPNGQSIPISSLVEITTQSGIAEIEQKNLQMMSLVTGGLNNNDFGSVLNAIQVEIANKIHLPIGYYIEYAGAYKDQQQSFKELLLVLITSSLLVFGVLIFLFRVFRAAFVLLFISVLGIL